MHVWLATQRVEGVYERLQKFIWHFLKVVLNAEKQGIKVSYTTLYKSAKGVYSILCLKKCIN